MGNTQLKEIKEVTFKLHIAIDFGTDGCGLAFAYKDKVYIYDKFKTNKRQRIKKTKTHILLNSENEVVCFGNNAKYMYSSLSGTEQKTWGFFERFKMALYDGNLSPSDGCEDNKNDDIDTANSIRSANGKAVSSEIVFAAAFRHLQGLAKQYLPKLTNDAIHDDEIQWIVTVPAIWSETAKDKMKRWIITAGLVDPYIKDQCLIVYEPDCASLAIQKEYFRNENVANKYETPRYDDNAPDIIEDDDAAFEPGSIKQDRFAQGDKYILVDAGGGTVDIACHEVQKDGSVEEIVYPTGDKWGSCYIDDLYIKVLEDIFSKQWMDEFKATSSTVYVDILDCFQLSKATFYEDSQAITHCVQLPFEFAQFLEEKCHDKDDNMTPEHMIKNYMKPIEYFEQLFMYESLHQEEDDKKSNECLLRIMTTKDEEYLKENCDLLEMDIRIWKCLFDSKINNIITHVHKLLNMNALRDQCSKLCLVGGFSASLYFQQRMKDAFGMQSKFKLTLIIPRKPILSVVEGAAYFGITQNYIKARKLRYTYGIRMVFSKQSAKKRGISEEYIKNNTTKDGKVGDCFKVIVHKNERVGNKEVRINESYRRGQISVVAILRSDKHDPTVAVEGEELAMMQVPHQDAQLEVITEFHFYGTMLKVYAYAKSNPNGKQQVDIKYVK